MAQMPRRAKSVAVSHLRAPLTEVSRSFTRTDNQLRRSASQCCLRRSKWAHYFTSAISPPRRCSPQQAYGDPHINGWSYSLRLIAEPQGP